MSRRGQPFLRFHAENPGARKPDIIIPEGLLLSPGALDAAQSGWEEGELRTTLSGHWEDKSIRALRDLPLHDRTGPPNSKPAREGLGKPQFTPATLRGLLHLCVCLHPLNTQQPARKSPANNVRIPSPGPATFSIPLGSCPNYQKAHFGSHAAAGTHVPVPTHTQAGQASLKKKRGGGLQRVRIPG